MDGVREGPDAGALGIGTNAFPLQSSPSSVILMPIPATRPAACSFPGENDRSWEALGEARPGQSSLSAGQMYVLCIEYL